MPAPTMEKTKAPGIFKRGGRYVIVYRDADGRQRKESARTYDEARRLKARRTAQRDSGELAGASRQTLHEYVREWIDRYQGGQRGFRDQTREDYRGLLELYPLEHFPAKLKLVELTPLHVARFVGWLCDGRAQAEHTYRLAVRAHEKATDEGRRSKPPRPLADDAVKVLSDKTVRNVLCPLRACLSTARREGLIRHNPADGAQLPNRPKVDDELEDGPVRAFTREQLAAFLLVVDRRHRVMFRLLAATGLRVSEVVALQWRHLQLDGSRPHVKVRRGIVRGRVGPPKTKQSRRDVGIPAALVDELRAHRKATEYPGDDDLVFPSLNGQSLNVSNVRRRVLKPAAEEAGASWAGFHTFRHTMASMLFERGANAKQVQRTLGHHSAAFTLSTYVHLLDDDQADALDLDAELSTKVDTGVATKLATSAPFGEAEADYALLRNVAA
ncbi:MAG: site-specific integrase [Solirubrobacteraceae bacterium]